MAAAAALWALALAASMAGQIVVGWAPVTLNTDGTPATDLRSYTIHRRSGSSWLKLAEVPATVTSAIVSLPPGTNLVRVTVFNRHGESNSSTTNIVMPVPRMVTGITGSDPQ